MLLTGRAGTADSIPGFIVPGVGPAPTVETISASHVSAKQATLRGTINPNELATEYHFEYWEGEERPAEPSRVPAKDVDAGEGTDVALVSQAVTGLKRRTTYSFRLIATNSAGEGIGAAVAFYTQPVQVAVTREYPSDKIAIRVDPPGGAPARWAEDEPGVENLIAGYKHSSDMPGGHKDLSGALARDPRRDWPDLAPYSSVKAYQPGSEVIWEGRIDKRPESEGERMVIEPAAVGHRVALEDRKGLVGPGFINADQSAWGDPSIQRRVNLGEGTRLDASTVHGWQGTGEKPPGIDFDFKGISTEKEKHDRGEATFYSEGPDIGALLYRFIRYAGGSGAEWFTMARLSADAELKVGLDEGENHEAASHSNAYERLDAGGEGRRYATFTSDRNESGEGGATLADLHGWENPKVLGNHGLTLQGEWPNVGFTAKQCLEWAILNFTDLTTNEAALDDDDFIIPHAWFPQPSDMAEVVKELTKYGLYYWFVYTGKLFELRKPGTFGREWQAYSGPAELKESGLDSSRLWRSIVVRYQDVDGSTRTVGPSGSGCNLEVEGLEITDPDHPAVKAGVTREDVLDLQGISVAEFAQEVGERWLEDANNLYRSGTASLKGYLMDSVGVFRPVAQVKAGDRIRFRDTGDSSAREITAADYDHTTRTCNVSLDAPPESVEALLERYRANLIPLGVG
jgi:hypothetical protein